MTSRSSSDRSNSGTKSATTNSDRGAGSIVPRAHNPARLAADPSVGNLAAARLRGGWLGVDLVQEIAKAYLTPGGRNGGGVGTGNKGTGDGGGGAGAGAGRGGGRRQAGRGTGGQGRGRGGARGGDGRVEGWSSARVRCVYC